MIHLPTLSAMLVLLSGAAPARDAPPPKKPAIPSARPVAAKPAAKDKPAPAKPKAASAKPAAEPLGDHAAKGDFGVLQVSAPDATQFVANWGMGTASQAVATRTVADKPLFVFIIFHGCKPDADGKCDLVADFAIHRPDGSVDDDHKGMAIWRRAPSDDPAKLILGDGALGFGTDSEGPFGDYRITATVTDRVAGVTLTTEQVLTVAKQ